MPDPNPYESPEQPNDNRSSTRATRLATTLGLLAIPLAAIAGGTTCGVTALVTEAVVPDIYMATILSVIFGVPIGLVIAKKISAFIKLRSKQTEDELEDGSIAIPSFLSWPASCVLAGVAAYCFLSPAGLIVGWLPFSDSRKSDILWGSISTACGYVVIMLIWQGLSWLRNRSS